MKSVGIEIIRDGWVVTVLEASRSGVRIDRSRLIGGSATDRLDGLRELLSRDGLKGCRICVGLPRDGYISRVLHLPAPDQKAIEGVVRFELERHIPFQMSEVHYGFQVLGRENGLFNVLVTVVEKELLGKLLEPFEGLNGGSLYVESFQAALFNALHQWSELPGQGSFSLVYIRSDVITVDTFAGCVPVDSREVEKGSDDWVEWMSALGRELKQVARVTQATHAAGRPQHILVVCEVPVGDDFFHALGDLTGLTVKHVKPFGFGLPSNALPSAGIALGALDRGRLSSNLSAPDGDLRRRPAALRTAVLASVAALLWISVGASYLVGDLLAIRRLDAALESLEDDTDGLRVLSEKLKALDGRIKTLEAADGRTGPGPMDVLKELSGLLPDGTWLAGFEYRNGVVYLDGRSDRASSLLLMIERSDLMEDVEFLGKISKGSTGKEHFSIKAKVKSDVGRI